MKIFISHSSVDKKFVRTLKDDLNENGFETFVDEDELEIGDSLVERLEFAINNSSHFLIILSPNAIGSSWVTKELNQALELMKGKLIEKIIPIKYRRCDIPKELNNLIYADLSDETVQTDGDKIKFLGDGYSKVLIKLIKTLSSSEKKLTQKDKHTLIDEVSEIETKIDENNTNLIRAQNKFVGYSSVFWYEYYKERIKIEKGIKGKETEMIVPVVLPSIYKGVFKNLKIGDEIIVERNNSIVKCQFCAFRFKDNSIALPKETREVLSLSSENNYNITIDLNKRMIIIA